MLLYQKCLKRKMPFLECDKNGMGSFWNTPKMECTRVSNRTGFSCPAGQRERRPFWDKGNNGTQYHGVEEF